jgi:hemerythrin-like domain-containing protein
MSRGETTMTVHHPMPDPAASDEPLVNFSQCHIGITRQLQALAELPPLLEPAAKARRIARESVAFFHGAVHEHHSEEERELFPAVLGAANAGAERDGVRATVERLVAEHRQIEAMWSRLEPALQAVARGHDSDVDIAAVQRLVDTYLAHARYEEAEFLPLSQSLLSRNSNHMAALGLSMHMRHAVPAMLERYGHRI